MVERRRRVTCLPEGFRNFQYAFRASAAFVVSVLLTQYMSDADNKDLIWVVSLLSVLLLQDTFGGTMFSGLMMMILYLPIVLFLYIVQVHFGVGYHNYLSSTLVYVFLSFTIGYYNKMVAIRKLLLLLPAIVIPTLVQTPREEIKDNLLWGLFGAVALAFVIDVVVSLLVLPRFATIEILDRTSYAARNAKEVLNLAGEALLSTHTSFAHLLVHQGEDIVKTMLSNQETLLLRCRASILEPSRVLRKMYRPKQQLFQPYSMQQLTLFSSSLLLHASSMLHAITKMHFNARHAVLIQKITHEMESVVKTLGDCLDILSGDDDDDVDRQNAGHDQDREHMNQLIGIAVAAKKQLFVTMRDAMESVSGGDDDDDVQSTSANNTNGPKENYLTTPPTPLAPPPLSVNYDIYANTEHGANRLAFSFFLFHMSELLQLLRARFSTQCKEEEEEAQRSLDEAYIKAEERKAESNVPETDNYDNGATNASAGASAFAVGEVPTPQKDRPIVKLLRFLLIIPPNDWRERVAIGWYTCVLCGIGLVFVEVPVLARHFENGQWILMSMVMSQGENLGGTISQIRLRLLGTMTGSIYAYFIYVVVGSRIRMGTIMFLPFLFLCTIIRQNRSWSYFGTVCAMTAIIMWLGRTVYGDSPDGNFAMLRVQQNAIGCILVAVASLFSVPQLASDLLKLNIVNVLQTYKESVLKIFHVFENVNKYSLAAASVRKSSQDPRKSGNIGSSIFHADTGSVETNVAITSSDLITGAAPVADSSSGESEGGEIKQQEKVSSTSSSTSMGLQLDVSLGDWKSFARHHIYSQTPLIEHAAMEFMLFRSSTFPSDKYLQLVYQQRVVLLLLFSMENTLRKFADVIVVKMRMWHCTTNNNNIDNIVEEDMSDSVAQLLLLLRHDVRDVTQATVDCLHKWSKMLLKSVVFHSIFSDGSLKTALKTSSFFPITDEEDSDTEADLVVVVSGGTTANPAATAGDEGDEYSPVLSEIEEGSGSKIKRERNVNNSSNSRRQFMLIDYARDIAAINSLSNRLSANSAKLNMAFVTTERLRISSSSSSSSSFPSSFPSSSTSSGQVDGIVKAFEVSCAANGLLYTSSQLAQAVGNVGEQVLGILELESDSTHIKAF